MSQVKHTSSRTASRRLARAVSFLHLASQQLSAASQASPNRYHQTRLHGLAVGLRDFSLPLRRIASILERGDR